MQARVWQYILIHRTDFNLKKESSKVIFFILFRLNVAFNNLSVILRRFLDVTGSSVLTVRVLPHWNITPQTHDVTFHSVTLYWHRTNSAVSMLSANERTANTIFKVFGMTQPGIEPTTSRTQTGCSSYWVTAPEDLKVIGLLIWKDFTTTHPVHDKTNEMTGLPGKIRSKWVSARSDLSLLCTQWVAKELRFLRVGSKNWSDWADALGVNVILLIFFMWKGH